MNDNNETAALPHLSTLPRRHPNPALRQSHRDYLGAKKNERNMSE